MTDYEILQEALRYLEADPKVEFNPWPEYDGRVYAALGTLMDINYSENYEKLDPDAVETMTLGELATIYTFILRGERFCDGHIASYIEDGSLKRLVKRHLELLEEKTL